MSKKRSAVADIAQGDLFEVENDSVSGCCAPSLGGVGARHSLGAVLAGGGEYLNNCDLSNFSFSNLAPIDEKNRRDPRFAELEKIGIPTVWLRIAERVGFDTWLDVWRMLSDDESVRHDGGARLPKLRCYSAYSRYQRNRYICSLAKQGMPLRVIQELLRKNLREFLDITNIQRISKRAKVNK